MYLQNSQLLFSLKSARTEEDAQGVDDAGDVAKDGQQDVDEEVGIATALKENTKRGQDDGEDDFDDVAAIVLAGPISKPCDTPPRADAPERERTNLPVKGMMAIFRCRCDEDFVWEVCGSAR